MRNVLQETEGVRAEAESGRRWEGREMGAHMKDGVEAPEQENDHHDGGGLHNLQGFIAGFVDALDVLPPEINGGEDGDAGRGEVHRQLRYMAVRAQQRGGEPV